MTSVKVSISTQKMKILIIISRTQHIKIKTTATIIIIIEIKTEREKVEKIISVILVKIIFRIKGVILESPRVPGPDRQSGQGRGRIYMKI